MIHSHNWLKDTKVFCMVCKKVLEADYSLDLNQMLLYAHDCEGD